MERYYSNIKKNMTKIKRGELSGCIYRISETPGFYDK